MNDSSKGRALYIVIGLGHDWGIYNFIRMNKSQHNFFRHSNSRTSTPPKIKIKTELNYETRPPLQEFLDSFQETRTTFVEKKIQKSPISTPKRMTTSYLTMRKTFGEPKDPCVSRNTSDGRCVMTPKSSVFGNPRNKKSNEKKVVDPIASPVLPGECAEFFGLVQRLEEQYLDNYGNERYEEAAKVLLKILNYAIDFKLPKHFLRTIRQMAEFYSIINKNNISLFYFDQCRLCAFKLNDPQILIESMIGCSLCCCKEDLFQEAIVFLKKGLQCCWFYNRSEQELRIYDELGKVHYLMGDLEKAIEFHEKFINAIGQPELSPQRTLSRQRMNKLISEEEDFKISDTIDAIFLASLSIQILTIEELPLISSNACNFRGQFNISTKYFCEFAETRNLLRKILMSIFYRNEMEQPESVVVDRINSSTNQQKKKKFDFIDFKLKQHLREMGIYRKQEVDLKPKHLEYKESLDEKVKRKLQEPELDSGWVNKMVKEIRRDRQNKLFKIQSQIRVRGKNRVIKPEMEQIRKIISPLH